MLQTVGQRYKFWLIWQWKIRKKSACNLSYWIPSTQKKPAKWAILGILGILFIFQPPSCLYSHKLSLSFHSIYFFISPFLIYHLHPLAPLPVFFKPLTYSYFLYYSLCFFIKPIPISSISHFSYALMPHTPSILQSFRSALATLCFAKNFSILQSFNSLVNEESLEPTFRQSKASSALIKKAASYSPALHCSTIGAGGLNFSVRNGKRWNPAAITTWYGYWPITQDKTKQAIHETGCQLKAWANICSMHEEKVFGLLVRLGFDVTVFTPASYQRRSLRRPSKEI